MEDRNVRGSKALIAAVLVKAYQDATSTIPSDDPEGAKRFINKDCWLFSTYCNFIGLNPEWVAKKMQDKINKKLMARKRYKDRYAAA